MHHSRGTHLHYCKNFLPLAMDMIVESSLAIPLGDGLSRKPSPGTRSPLYSAVGFTDMPVLHHAALMCTAMKHCPLHALIIRQPVGHTV